VEKLPQLEQALRDCSFVTGDVTRNHVVELTGWDYRTVEALLPSASVGHQQRIASGQIRDVLREIKELELEFGGR